MSITKLDALNLPERGLVMSPAAIYYSLLIVKHHTGQLRINRREGIRSRLCFLLLILSVLPLLGFSIPSSNANAVADGPEVVMALTKRDFGDVFAGEDLEQNFPVRNIGNKPLELSQKSTLGLRPAAPTPKATAALWRPSDNVFIRSAAAVRAAPS